jgi:hypothetical protein
MREHDRKILKGKSATKRATKFAIGALAFATLALHFPLASFAQGGPPMATDDPGTPGDRHWEINLATLMAFQPNRSVIEAPYADLNYGWGERVQLKFEAGWSTLSQTGEPERGAAGPAIAGVKYRFYESGAGGLAISTYPQIEFPAFFAGQADGSDGAGAQFIAPIEASQAFGQWEVNPEIGFRFGGAATDQVFFGVVLAFEGAGACEPLLEAHGNAFLDGSGTEALFNLGFRYALSSSLKLIGATGYAVELPGSTQPELNAYAGVQLIL